MKKTLSMLLLLINFSALANSQNQIIDSLWNVYENTKEKKTQILLLSKLAGQYINKNPDTTLLLAEQIIANSKKINDKSGLGSGLSWKGTFFRKQRKYKLARSILLEAKAVFESIDNIDGIYYCLSQMGHSYNIKYCSTGDNEKALDYYHQALILENKLQDKSKMDISLIGIGDVYYKKGEINKAISYYQKANKYNKNERDKVRLSLYLYSMGNAYSKMRNYSKALAYYQQSLAIVKALNLPDKVSQRLFVIGNVHRNNKDYQQALENYQQALGISKTSGNQYMSAKLLNNIGMAYKNIGNYHQALEAYQQALTINKALGNQKSITKNLNNLGDIYKHIGNYQQVFKLYQQALTINEVLGNKESICYNLYNLGATCMQIGDNKQALIYLEKSLVMSSSLVNNKELITKILERIGKMYLLQKNYKKALESFEKALLTNEGKNNKEEQSNLLLQISTIYTAQKDYEKALKYSTKALKLYEHIGDKNRILSSLVSIGLIYFNKGDYEQANAFDKRALKIVEQIEPNHKTFNVLLNAVEIYEKKGNNSLIEKYLEQAEKIANQQNSLLKQNKIAIVAQRIYKKHQNFFKYVKYTKIYQATRDSLYNRDVANAVQKFKIRYETENQEKEIAFLTQENQLKELQLKNTHYLIVFSIGLLIILLILSVFLYILYKSSKKIAQLEKFQREKAEYEKQQFEKLATLEKKQAQKLAEINSFRSNLFANISHELRTPLSLLHTPLKQMKAGVFKGDKQQYFDIMFKNTSHLLNLVGQMLDLSKLNEGKTKLNQDRVEISSFTKHAIAQFESAIFAKQIQFKLEIPTKNIYGIFDKEMMSKVLTNLLSNAIKFSTSDGQILMHIHFKANNWIITIQDNGVGIASSEIKLIFDRYYRGYLGKNSDTTGGLGLTLVKQVVELHKGTIEVKSKKGDGTTFKVIIPCLETTESEFKAKEMETIVFSVKEFNKKLLPTHPPKVINAKQSHLPLLVIIEDNVDLNNLITNQLGDDYRIIQTYNGKDGFAQAKKRMPDFILSDLMMPTLDGFNFLKLAKQSPLIRHIPIIVLSALEQHITDSEVWKSGILDFIPKPIDFTILKHKLDNFLTNKKRFQERYSTQNIIHEPSFNRSIQLPPAIDLDNNYLACIPIADQDLIKRFQQFVSKNLSDSTINIDLIATKMFVSRRHLHKKVKSILGVPPASYIRSIRLQKAYHLLQKKQYNVGEVARQVGIPKLSYFSTVFKNEFGFPPRNMSSKIPM